MQIKTFIKLVILVFTILIANISRSQTTITVVDGTSKAYNYGIPSWYYYGYNQYIFLQPTINNSGVITHIQIECSIDLDAINPVKIYMSETTK